jgi:tetratricopeptide (TPR) repeat protein
MKAWKFTPLVVVAAGLLAYCNSFTGSYFLDDFHSIPENPTIRHLWPLWQCLSPPHQNWLTVEGRPLINLSLAINYALGGYHVWGYHALNLTVHILAGLTLFGVVRRTLLQPPLRNRFGAAANELALATAVLWTVHPLQTESVTYIVQRAESIMGLFYLLTLYCFIRGVESQRGRLWYGLSVTACALGMTCKEVMVSAPLMVLLYDRAFVSSSFREAWRQRRPLYLALASTWIVLGYLLFSAGILSYASSTAQRIGRWEYLATQPGVILYYLRLSVWPHPLTMYHNYPIADSWMSILPPTVVVVSLLAASVWAWRKRPVWGFLGAWFFLILAPSSSVIPLPDAMYEHRVYLSLAAVVSLVVTGLFSLAGRRILIVLAAVAIGLGVVTWRRNQDFQANPHFSLGVAYGRAGRFQEAIREYEQARPFMPRDAYLHYNLGVALMGLSRFQEAIDCFGEALRLKPDFADAHSNLGYAFFQVGQAPAAIGHWEQSLQLKPEDAKVHYNLGIALGQCGKMPDAIEHLEQAVRLDPGWAAARTNLADALRQVGASPEVIEQSMQALQHRPDDATAHYNSGIALAKAGRTREAIAHYQQSLRINPNSPEVHKNLGNALLRLGNVQEAIEHYEQALRLKPEQADAHNNLGIALERAGRAPEAVGQYEQALRLKPDFAEAYNNLASALLGLGQVETAIEHYNHALRIQPEDAEAHYNLGIALETAGRTQEAIGQYEQALRIKPDFAEAKNKLMRLRAVP